jgi:hypothetical protein
MGDLAIPAPRGNRFNQNLACFSLESFLVNPNLPLADEIESVTFLGKNGGWLSVPAPPRVRLSAYYLQQLFHELTLNYPDGA